jgi:hypothetical protein
MSTTTNYCSATYPWASDSLALFVYRRRRNNLLLWIAATNKSIAYDYQANYSFNISLKNDL